MGTTIMETFYNNEGSYKIPSKFGTGKTDAGFAGYDVMQKQQTNNGLLGTNNNVTNSNVTYPNGLTQQDVNETSNINIGTTGNTSSGLLSGDMISSMFGGGNTGESQGSLSNITQGIGKAGTTPGGSKFGNAMQGSGGKALAASGDAMFSGITKKYEDKWAPKADADGIITDDRKDYQKGAMLGYAKGSSKGASMGTQIMPGWGTLIGAVVGGIGGTIMGDSQLKKETRDIKANNQNIEVSMALKNMDDIRTSYEEKKQRDKQQQQNITPGQNKKYSIENGMMYQNGGNGMIPLQY
jgi:hypothetical protein